MSTTFEVGTRGGEVTVILSVQDEDAGAVSATGVSLLPDEARELCNAVGGALMELSRMVMT